MTAPSVAGASAGSNSAPGRSSAAGRFLMLLVVVGAIVLVVVSAISRPPVPFDLDSSAPNGMRAVKLLLRSYGITGRTISSKSSAIAGAGQGTVIYVPAPDFASREFLGELRRASERGAVVIYGSTPPSVESGGDDDNVDASWVHDLMNDELISLEPTLVAPKTCTIPELEGLGRIDAVMDIPVDLPLGHRLGLPTDPQVVGSCYGSLNSAQFVEVRSGAGRTFILGSPYLWVNSRLQPDKENGGKVLDNGVTALRLFATGRSGGEETTVDKPGVEHQVLFVDAVPSAESIANGTKGIFELMPNGFKALLGVLALALMVFIWSRATRLGQPVEEAAEVKINSSELTAAIARLFEADPVYLRTGAETLRSAARADFARAVGMPVTSDPNELCRVVGEWTHREPAQVFELLYGPLYIDSAADLVVIESRIEQLRTEMDSVTTG